MPWTLQTKDGITISGIPDDVTPETHEKELRERVATERAKREGAVNPETIRSVVPDMEQADNVEPRDLARIQSSYEIGSRLGVPAEKVDGPNYEGYAQAAGFQGDPMDDFGQIQKSDQRKAGIKDFVTILKGSFYLKPGRKVGQSFFSSIPQTAGRSAQGLVAANLAASEIIMSGLDKVLPKSVSNFLKSPIPESIDIFGSTEKLGKAVESAGASIDIPESERDLSTEIASGVGQIVTQAVATFFNPSSGTAMMFAEGAEQQERRAQEAGEKSPSAVLAGGAATAVTEKIQLGRLIGKTPYLGKMMDLLPDKVKSKWMGKSIDVAGAGLGEGIQENVEGALQDAIALATYNPDQKFFQQWKEEAMAAGGAGMAFRFLVNAVAWGRTRIQYSEMGDSPVVRSLERGGYSPEAFKQLSKALSKTEFSEQFETPILKEIARSAWEGNSESQELLASMSEATRQIREIEDAKALAADEDARKPVPEFEMSEAERIATEEFSKLDPAKFDDNFLSPDQEAELERIGREEEVNMALVESVDFDSEILKKVKKYGGLLKGDDALQGELDRIRENLKENRMNRGVFKEDAKSLHELREALADDGFAFDTEAEMLSAIDEAASGFEVYPMQGGGVYSRPRAPKQPNQKLSVEERILREKERITERMQKRIEKERQRLEEEKIKGRSRVYDARIKAAKRLKTEMDKRIAEIKKLRRERKSATRSIRTLEKMVKALPVSVRGRFSGFGTLASKISPEKQNELIDKYENRIHQIFSDYIISESKKAYRKTIKQTLRNKQLPVELEPIRTIDRISRMGEEKVSETYDEIVSKDELTIEDKEALYMLDKFGSIESSKSPDRWVNATSALLDFINDGKSEVRARKEEYARKVSENVDKGLEDVGYTRATVPTEKSLKRKDEAKGFLKEFMTEARFWVADRMDGLEFVLDNLSRTKGRFNGWLYNEFFPRAFKAQEATETRNKETMSDMAEAIDSAVGDDLSPKERIDLVRKWNEPVESTGIYFKSEGRIGEQEMSKWEAIDFWMLTHDKSLKPTWKKMLVATDDDFDSSFDTFKESLENFIGEDGKRVGRELMKEYGKLGEEYQMTRRSTDGYSPRLVENYTPLVRRKTDGEIQMVSADEAMNIGDWAKATEKFGSLKERTNNTLELVPEPAHLKFANHAYQMNHYIEHAQLAKDVRNLFDNPIIRRAFWARAGTNKINTEILKTQLYGIIRGGIDHAKVNRAVSSIASNLAVSKIALNPASSIKQWGSIPSYANEMPAREWARREAALWSNPFEIRRAVSTLLNTEYMKNRTDSGQIIELKEMLDKKGFDAKVAGIRGWRDRIMFMTRFGDFGAIIMGGWPVYKHHYDKSIKAGMSESEAAKVAEFEFSKATDRAQQSAKIFSLGYWQQSGSFGKLFTMFMTSPIQYQRNVNNALRSYFTKTLDGQRRISARDMAKTVFIYHVVLPQIFTAMGSAFIGLWDDDEEVQEKFWKRQKAALLTGNLNSIMMFGQGIQSFSNLWLGDEKYFMGDQSIPVLSVTEDVVRAAAKGAESLFDGEFSEASISLGDMIGQASSFFGVPYEPTKKFGKAVVDSVTGETDHPWLGLLGFGDYALMQEEKSSNKNRRSERPSE